MPVIPEPVFRQIEKRLRDRHTAEARAEQALYRAQQRAYSISSPAADRERVQGGGADGSRVERAAAAILRAEEALDTVRKWEHVFRLADRSFPPGTPEGKAVALVYRDGHTKKAAAQILRCTRVTLDSRLINFICHVAVYAAADGLIEIKGVETH